MKRRMRGPVRPTVWSFAALAILVTPTVTSLALDPAAHASRAARPQEPAAVTGTGLERGISRTGTIRSRDTHIFEIHLEPRQYARLVVDQRDVDVAVRCIGPDGTRIGEVDGRESVVEAVSVIAEKAGPHRFALRATGELAVPRTYTITLEVLRPAEDADALQIEAEEGSTEAKRQFAVGTADALRLAQAQYERVLPVWRKVGDRTGEGDALSQLGTIALLLGDPRRGLELYEQGLAVFRANGNTVGQAAVLGNIAATHSSMGDKPRAASVYGEALTIARAAGDRNNETVILGNLGTVHHSLGNPTLALTYASDALAIARARGDGHWEAQALNTTAGVYSIVGDNERAAELFRDVAAKWHATGNTRGEAIATANAGTAYLLLGDVQRALGYQAEGVRLLQALGDRRSAATVLVSVGRSYEQLGDLPSAVARLEEALGGARAVADRRAEAMALAALGHVYRSQGQPERARDTYAEALPLLRTVGDRLREAAALSELGDLAYARHDGRGAAEYHTQALALARAASDRNGEAAVLLNLGRSELLQGRLAEARVHVEAALAIVESLRGRVSSPELRATYLAAKRDLYETYVDLLMRQHAEQPSAGFDAQALQAAERARARTLLELLAEARADIRRGVDPALLVQERALSENINAKASRQTALRATRQTEQQADPLTRELESLLGEYQDVQARIRATSPRYAALTQPEPLTVAELRRRVLDPDTVLLEYALGDERSYAWLLTQTQLTSVELPKRAAIEALARRFYVLVAGRPEGDATRAAVREAAHALAGAILDPVASSLTGRRILLVADGALQYVPFGALPLPRQSQPASVVAGARADDATMLATYELVLLPSAATLAVLRQELSGRPAAPKLVAVLADPVFHADDSRVRRAVTRGPAADASNAAHGTAGRDLERTVADVGIGGGERLPRLPFSRREAESILARVPRGSALNALDFAASRDTALGPDLRRHRLVHIATHGLLNATHPELSGLVLSLVDEQGRPRDGFLRLHEIYNLDLAADLVVLSACRTGLGQDVKGEGLVGLTRGFMYAGAARVVVSLWTVDDEATAALMTRFYDGVLGSGALSPAEALRRAQLSMAKVPRWRSPYYWAGFVLQGEYRPGRVSASVP